MKNKVKKFIKSNFYLTIFFDYLIGLTGVNLEKEYRLVNNIQNSFPIIIDIGAHKGESIKSFLRHKPGSIIHSFEPNSLLAKNLENKFKENLNIHIYNAAVSKKKSLFLFTPVISGFKFTMLSSINKTYAIYRIKNFFHFKTSKTLGFIKERVKTISIDSLLIKADLIKIDTEGSEYEVIQTCKKTIIKNKPILIIEYSENSYFRLKKFTQKLGFKPFLYDPKKNNLIQINKEVEREIEKESNLINIVYKYINK
jgi:FkbM family methyltransferase